MRIVSLQLDSRSLDILISAVSYAISNLDDLNDALESNIQEHELSKLRDILEAKK